MRGKRFLASVFVLATTTAASASIVNFDPDGPGPDPAVQAATFDWLPGDALFVENNSPADDGGTNSTLYFQAKLGSILGPNGQVLSTPGLNAPGGFEITGVFGIDVNAQSSGQAVVFTQSDSPQVSYFSMYYDPAQNANNLAGTGFRLGPTATKIYGSDVEYLLGSAAVSVTGPSVPLDLADPTQYAGITTPVASGGDTIDGSTTSVDSAFFLDGSNVTAQLTNGTLIAPFTDVDPSMEVRIGPDGSTVILPFAVNSENGDSGMVQFESDAATSFQVVPEPATAGLLFPLAALLLGRRRRRVPGGI